MSDSVKTENIEPEYFECEGECNNLENVHKTLLPHISIQKQQFTCDLCAMSYSLKNDLQCHLNVHTGLGIHTFDDDICLSTFTKTGSLKLHSRTVRV